MRTRTALAVTAGIVVVAAVIVALAVWGGGSDRATPGGQPQAGAPTIVTVYEDVNWYPPCATYPIELGGRPFYPLPMGAPPVDESKYPLPAVDALGWEDSGWVGSPIGTSLSTGLQKVVAPGPGDDVGTVIEYSDGMARFESESGNVAWLTVEVQEYGYVC